MANKKPSNPVVALISGGIAGGIELTCTWPSEYCKTLLQLQRTMPDGTKEYKGMFDCAKQQVIRHGPIGLYRGYLPALLFAMPKAGVRFGAFQFFQNNMIKITTKDKDDPLLRLGAGMLAGGIEGALVVTPQDTIKTKLIELNTTVGRGMKHMYRHGGIKSFYQGVFPTIIKQSSNQGLRFWTYGVYRDFITKGDKNYKMSTIQAIGGGLCAGTCATCLNNPLDMIKTRMQGVSAKEYNGAFDCVKKVLKNEGPLAFYKGLFSRLSRVVPGQGIVFGSYETIARYVSDTMGYEY